MSTLWDTLVRSMARTFRGLERAHGVYNVPASAQRNQRKGGKVEGDLIKTVRAPVTEALWARHLAGTQGLGIIPVNDTGISYFGAIDVDVYPTDVAELERKCQQLRIPLLPTVTKSGGVHLYTFSAAGVPANLLRAKLGEWAVALGYPGSEIYPKQDYVESEGDIGNWINMPYYGCTSDVAQDRVGVLNGDKLDLERYLARAAALGTMTAQDLEGIKVNMERADDFTQSPPCLQCLATKAGFGMGARNNALFNIAVYLRKRYPDDWVSRLHYYNIQYMQPPLLEPEVKTIIKSAHRKNYSYLCKENPIRAVCNKEICGTREFGVQGEELRWGITIDDDCFRVNTNPPYWLIGVNGVQVRVTSDDLQNQLRFQRICMEQVKYMPPLLPTAKWMAVINPILTRAKVIDAPADASPRGELAYHLEQFCTVFPQAETREEIQTGKPYTDPDKGYTYFRSDDLRKYLDSQKFRAIPSGQVYAELRELGVDGSEQFWMTGNKNIRVWRVKSYKHDATPIPARHAPVREGDM